MQLKDKILSDLGNDYISGSSLAKKYEVSRNAIWKSINSLKKDGYDIISDKKGYILNDNNKLSSALIKKNLNKDIDVFIYDTIDSTNDEAKRLLPIKDSLIVSNRQTKGKGRCGKSFYSPKDSGIYLSLVIHPNIKLNDALKITSITSVALCDALIEICNINPKIKWVNDIYLNNKKISGILTEAITDFETGITNTLIIGIGININTSLFPDELNSIATSINKKINRNKLIAKITNNIYDIPLNDTSYLNKYKEYSCVLNKEIIYYENDVPHNATAKDIDQFGALIVDTENGTIKLSSGLISLRVKG